MKPGYVIFICLFDLFKQDKAVYSFEMYDKKNRVHLGDGQLIMFLNTVCRGNGIPAGLRSLFLYLEENTVDESDLWICRLRDAVKEMEAKKEVRSKMTLYDEWLITAKEMERIQQALKESEADKEKTELECRQAEAEYRFAEARRQQAEVERERAEAECQQAKDQFRRFQLLSKHLLDQNCTEDLKLALENETYRNKLFEEYGIQ